MSHSTAEALATVLEELVELAKGSEPDLRDAPTLDGWRIVVDEEGFSHVGRVTGHPMIANHSLVQTSALLAIGCDQSWARTLNRFYRLLHPLGSPPMH